MRGLTVYPLPCCKIALPSLVVFRSMHEFKNLFAAEFIKPRNFPFRILKINQFFIASNNSIFNSHVASIFQTFGYFPQLLNVQKLFVVQHLTFVFTQSVIFTFSYRNHLLHVASDRAKTPYTSTNILQHFSPNEN